ncbi:hypothetical protein [Clostridium sp.]|jgi:hypothetical protein|uniref:hypothetical protein n=1 Tax=Clostridium sp. TaxID=1506 RepID=UPI003A5C16DF
MKKQEKIFFENICKYCIKNYTISNSSPIISSLIHEICNFLDIDSIAVRGVITININENLSRSFAHCFNLCNGVIVDSTIYEYALINNNLKHLIPLYVVENIPYNIDYIVQDELPKNQQFKFSKKFLKDTLDKIQSTDNIYLNRFNLIEDSKKQNLFFCR